MYFEFDVRVDIFFCYFESCYVHEYLVSKQLKQQDTSYSSTSKQNLRIHGNLEYGSANFSSRGVEIEGMHGGSCSVRLMYHVRTNKSVEMYFPNYLQSHKPQYIRKRRRLYFMNKIFT